MSVELSSFGFALQAIEGLRSHHRDFEAEDGLDGTVALASGLDVDAKDRSQALDFNEKDDYSSRLLRRLSKWNSCAKVLRIPYFDVWRHAEDSPDFHICLFSMCATRFSDYLSSDGGSTSACGPN